MKCRYNITGMSCAACVAHVERAAKNALASLDIDGEINVSLLTSSMSVEISTDTEKSSFEKTLIREITRAGYGASPADTTASTTDVSAKKDNQERQQLKRSWISFAVSAALTLLLMVFSMGHMVGINLITAPIPLALVQLALTLPVLVINRKYFIGGWRALIHLAPNMDSLIAIGSGASVVYGLFVLGQMIYYTSTGQNVMAQGLVHQLYFESAAMIVTLVSLGKNMEKGARVRASSAIRRLATLLPETAIIVQDGRQKEIPTSELKQGDIVLCREGELIPVDGTVLKGAASVNEAALTGESVPADKNVGDQVHAACTLVEGSLTVRADGVGDSTALSHILRLLEDAASSRAPVARLADRISLYFVPTVIGISFLTFIIWIILSQNITAALSFSISVMVISCPCALGLATPTAILVATGRGAEQGILFKSAEALEKLHEVETVALDKTGTMTEGQPEVTDVIAWGDCDQKEVLVLAAAVERYSTHPLSSAIVRYAQKEALTLPEAHDYASVIGEGVSAVVNDNICLIGKKTLLQKKGVNEAELAAAQERARTLGENGKTAVLVAFGNKIIGIIALADRLRDDTPAAIERLTSMGVQTVMLTGDNEVVAAAVAAQAGVSRYRAALLPGDKEGEIRMLAKQGSVAMIGDGINDAPALSRADVGIAIGAGTDVAIDCADVVLTKSNLSDVVDAVALSRHTMRIIAQNLFWALLYNTVCIPIAAGALSGAGVVLNPMLASAAMSLSSVCVVVNSLRLRRVDITRAPRKKRKNNDKEKEKKRVESNSTILSVKGMMCPHCVAHVKKALEAVEGADEVVVSLDDANATVSGNADRAALVAAVRAAGYECE